jgi:hypothetical protein
VHIVVTDINLQHALQAGIARATCCLINLIIILGRRRRGEIYFAPPFDRHVMRGCLLQNCVRRARITLELSAKSVIGHPLGDAIFPRRPQIGVLARLVDRYNPRERESECVSVPI